MGADLSQPAEALRLAAEVGEVDILVNNAGFAWFGPTEKLAADILNQLFAANVQAPYLLVSVSSAEDGDPWIRGDHQRG